MTDKDNDDSRDDVDWLKEAFDRAIQGDNGTVPEAARPAVNPFTGLTPTVSPAPIEPVVPIEPVAAPTPVDPTESDGSPSNRHDLDLDFETDDMPPVALFEPVVPLNQPLPTVATDYPPTEALDAVDLPVTAVPEPVVPNSSAGTVPPTSAEEANGIELIDALFASADTSDTTVPISALPVSSAQNKSQPARQTKPPRESTPVDSAKLRQRLLLILGGIVVVIVVIGAFLAGRLVATPAVAPTPEVTESPVATTAQPPGKYAFGELFGGECLDPFDSAWASTFTVVDCATPHSAQLVYAGDLAIDGVYSSYPGDDLIGSAAMAECSRKGVLNLARAKAYSDLLVSASYPFSSEAWDSGDTRYYCFVTLSSSAPIEADLAGKLITQGAKATPEPTATP